MGSLASHRGTANDIFVNSIMISAQKKETTATSEGVRNDMHVTPFDPPKEKIAHVPGLTRWRIFRPLCIRKFPVRYSTGIQYWYSTVEIQDDKSRDSFARGFKQNDCMGTEGSRITKFYSSIDIIILWTLILYSAKTIFIATTKRRQQRDGSHSDIQSSSSKPPSIKQKKIPIPLWRRPS